MLRSDSDELLADRRLISAYQKKLIPGSKSMYDIIASIVKIAAASRKSLQVVNGLMYLFALDIDPISVGCLRCQKLRVFSLLGLNPSGMMSSLLPPPIFITLSLS